MPKISELNPITSISLDDLVPVVNDPNGAPSTNKITFSNFANSVVNYIEAQGIFDAVMNAANTGNVSFSHTTISTRHAHQDLSLSPQGSNVYIGEGKNLVVSNIISEIDLTISANNDLVWNFGTEGALYLNSFEYNEIIGFGYGMGPTIASGSSLYTVSYELGPETEEYWEQGSLSYPESYQMFTQYSNSESNSTRTTEIYLHSDINDHVIGLGINDGGTINNRYWEFDKDGNINLPSGGIISDSFPIYKAKALEAYDQITWNDTTITFDNASSSELRDVLSLLQVGDTLACDGITVTVLSPYTGGTNGSIEVDNSYSISDVQLFELFDKRNLIEGIRIRPHKNLSSSNTWTFGIDGELTLPNLTSIGGSTYLDGITMTTPRGKVLFGNQPENIVTQSSHFHIMPEDSSAIDLIFGNDTNYVKLPRGTGNVEIGAEGQQWTFGSDGIFKLPNNNGQIGQLESPYTGLEFRTGSGADWIGISYGEIEDNNTSYFYFDKDDPDHTIANHRAHLQIKNKTRNGHVEWTFDSDGSISLPVNAEIGSESPFNITNAKTITTNNIVISDNIYDSAFRPLFNPNALDINADGGTSISIFAVRDEAFTGGGSRTVYSQYEAALDGGFSYNNRHSSNFIDGGGSNQI